MKNHIRFVDDDAKVLNGIRRSLSDCPKDWEIGYHNKATACLEALSTGDSVVVVTDWVMPGMDGMALCGELRRLEDELLGSYYVIVLTGKDDMDSLVEALDAGADDYLTKPFDRRELLARIRCGVRVLEAESALRLANQRLEAMATTDMLTGLANRRQAEVMLTKELERVGRDLESLAVMMLDIDHFKQINDCQGHAAGDKVLRDVARRMARCCRSYDLLARWGGEEFLLICPHVTDLEASTIAERVRSAVANDPFVLSPKVEIAVTISVGVASIVSGDSRSADILLSDADAMLYTAKGLGRNRVQIDSRSTNDLVP